MAKPEVTGAQRLLIDLGATNARFALQRAGAAPEQSMRISVRAQPDLIGAIRFYLAEIDQEALRASDFRFGHDGSTW